jgi:hypothetical protein
MKKLKGGKGRPKKLRIRKIPNESKAKEKLSEGLIANNVKIRKSKRSAQYNQKQGRGGPDTDFRAPAVKSHGIEVTSFPQLRMKTKNNIPFLYGVTNENLHKVPQQTFSAPGGGYNAGR